MASVVLTLELSSTALAALMAMSIRTGMCSLTLFTVMRSVSIVVPVRSRLRSALTRIVLIFLSSTLTIRLAHVLCKLVKGVRFSAGSPALGLMELRIHCGRLSASQLWVALVVTRVFVRVSLWTWSRTLHLVRPVRPVLNAPALIVLMLMLKKVLRSDWMILGWAMPSILP